MLKIYILWLVLFCSFKTLLALPVEITGRVMDEKNRKGLPYCYIFLKSRSDSTISAIISDISGAFIFKNVNISDSSHLEFHYNGYKNKILYLIQTKDKWIQLNEVYLSRSTTQLKETEITGRSNYIEQKFDRKVFNISDVRLNTAQTILDILKTLPGVVLDENGKIRYKGTEAQIYVDNQPSQFIYPNVEMIPVEKVSKIELIDLAMRSGGNGEGGIINIKLKQATSDGISGIISIKPGTINFKELNNSNNFLNVNYKISKLTFVNNFGIATNLVRNTRSEISTISLSEILYNRNDIQNFLSNELSLYDYLGAIYKPNTNSKLFFGIGISIQSLEYNVAIAGNEVENGTEKLNYDKVDNKIQDDKNRSIGMNFYFRHKFDTTERNIEINFDITNRNTQVDINSNTLYSYFNYSKIDSNYYEKTSSAIVTPQNIYLSVYYEHPFKKTARWNLEYTNNSILNDKSDELTFVSDTLYHQKIKIDTHTEVNQSLSFRIGTKINKFNIDIGINLINKFLEGKYIRNSSINTDTTIGITKNYFKLLPSATFAFQLNVKDEIKLTISRTSILPYFELLSDYIYKNNPFDWSTGNSKLKPVDFFSTYIGYTFNSNNLNTTAECFFNYSNNQASFIRIPQSDILVLTKYENVAKQTDIGIDLSLWVQLLDNLKLSFASTLYNSVFNTNAIDQIANDYNLPNSTISQNFFNYNLKANIDYSIKEYYSYLYFQYFSTSALYNGYKSPTINASFNLSRKFFKQRLQVGIGIKNLLSQFSHHTSHTSSLGITSDVNNNNSVYKTLFVFSIKYNFRKGDRGTKDMNIRN